MGYGQARGTKLPVWRLAERLSAQACIMAQHRIRAATSSLLQYEAPLLAQMGRIVAGPVASETEAHCAGGLQALPLLTGSETELREGRSRKKVVGATALGMGPTARIHMTMTDVVHRGISILRRASARVSRMVAKPIR